MTREKIEHMNYYKQGDAANADKIKAAFEKLGVYVGGYDFGRKDVLFFTFEAKGKTHLMSSVLDTGLDNIILTHPDYKELELPVQPNFKVGDWVVRKDGTTFYGGNYAEQITLIESDGYLRCIWLSSTTWLRDNDIRLWTIADARDGDVITNGKLIVIFNKLEEPAYKQHIVAYVGLDLCGRLQITEDTWQLGIDKAMPATKEQRDLLFAKMREVEYEWDAYKKELKKISKHYDIANFHAGMPVLIRMDNSLDWSYALFSHYSKGWNYPFRVSSCCSVKQCIPYNYDTKHLLGTTDMCPEEYINW